MEILSNLRESVEIAQKFENYRILKVWGVILLLLGLKYLFISFLKDMMENNIIYTIVDIIPIIWLFLLIFLLIYNVIANKKTTFKDGIINSQRTFVFVIIVFIIFFEPISSPIVDFLIQYDDPFAFMRYITSSRYFLGDLLHLIIFFLISFITMRRIIHVNHSFYELLFCAIICIILTIDFLLQSNSIIDLSINTIILDIDFIRGFASVLLIISGVISFIKSFQILGD